MTKVTTHVELDNDWVDAILITAFDGQYGGCNYWINEDDEIKAVRLRKSQEGQWVAVDFELNVDPEPEADRIGVNGWLMGVIDASRGVTATVNRQALSRAATTVLDKYPHGEAARQLRAALIEPDELPDLDAWAADALVQVALWGQIIYG